MGRGRVEIWQLSHVVYIIERSRAKGNVDCYGNCELGADRIPSGDG